MIQFPGSRSNRVGPAGGRHHFCPADPFPGLARSHRRTRARRCRPRSDSALVVQDGVGRREHAQAQSSRLTLNHSSAAIARRTVHGVDAGGQHGGECCAVLLAVTVQLGWRNLRKLVADYSFSGARQSRLPDDQRGPDFRNPPSTIATLVASAEQRWFC